MLELANDQFILNKYVKSGDIVVAMGAVFKETSAQDGTYPYMVKYEFPNGCALFIDSTGFIHIETNNPDIHDFSFTTLLDQPLSVYANDESTGNPIFNIALTKEIKGSEFHKKYYLPFAEFMKESVLGNEEFLEL